MGALLRAYLVVSILAWRSFLRPLFRVLERAGLGLPIFNIVLVLGFGFVAYRGYDVYETRSMVAAYQYNKEKLPDDVFSQLNLSCNDERLQIHTTNHKMQHFIPFAFTNSSPYPIYLGRKGKYMARIRARLWDAEIKSVRRIRIPAPLNIMALVKPNSQYHGTLAIDTQELTSFIPEGEHVLVYDIVQEKNRWGRSSDCTIEIVNE